MFYSFHRLVECDVHLRLDARVTSRRGHMPAKVDPRDVRHRRPRHGPRLPLQLVC